MNKKLLTSIVASVVVLTSFPAKANADVGAALIIGGIIGAAIANPSDNKSPPVINYPQSPVYGPYPVYRVPPPIYYPPNPVYHLMEVYDSSCNCIRMMPVRVR